MTIYKNDNNSSPSAEIQHVIHTLRQLTTGNIPVKDPALIAELNEAVTAFAIQSNLEVPEHETTAKPDPISQVYFNYALTGILETDKDWHILRANQAAACITGYEINQLVSQTLTFLSTIETAPKLSRHLDFLREQGISQSSWHMTRNDGKQIILDISSVQVDDQRFIHVFDDVTEIRNAAEVLHQAVIRAEEANKTKSQFLANVSHELRTPLNGLIGLSRLLASTSLDDRQREFVNKIYLSGVNLLRVVNDLLDSAKLEAGKMQYEDAPFTLSQLQNDLAATIALARENPALEVGTQIAPTVPDHLLGDRYRIAQCLINLLGNAIKFTPSGRISLDIDVVASDSQPAQLQFRVRDTGMGIPKEVIPRLFNSFIQADASTTRRFGGTGLGLAITRQIARDLGGDLTVESEEGTGSCFTLQLPLRVAHAAPATLIPEQLDVPDEFAGATILVAEDNEVNQIVISELLRLAGITALVAENGQALLQLIVSHPDPDLILMDVQMPVMDGIATTQALRSNRVTVPVIALSAGASKEEQARCLDAGMNDFLSKPIDADELWGCLTRWIRPKQTHPPVTGNAPDPAPQQEPVYHKVMQAFIKQHEQDADRLEHFIATNDGHSLRALAHSLKGAAALMGFEKVRSLAASLEQQMDKQEPAAVLAGTVFHLRTALAEAIATASQPG